MSKYEENILKPIQDKRKFYEENPEEVKRILNDGTNIAKNKAREKMQAVRKAMKIDY